MPDLVTHCFFAERVYNGLEKNIKQKIENDDLYLFASAGPDPFFFYKFLKRKKNAPVRAIGDYMHNNNTSIFFMSLINQIIKSCNRDLLFTYLVGFINHYAMDSVIHPYIFYKTGNYILNDENRLKYRGLHMRLERAIDVYFIRNHYHKNPNTIKIWRRFLKLKSIPKEIEEDLNSVYLNAYEYSNISNTLNKCIKDQRKFYKFIYDPTGIKSLFFKKMDNKRGAIDYRYLSYFNREIKDIDFLNIKNEPWYNPVNNQPSTENLLQLIMRASEFANTVISAVYDYIYLHKEIDLKIYFDNRSYLTGLKCDSDIEMIYFDNIFDN